MHGSVNERKVVIIVGLSLLVAIVTFGILQSSGTFTNASYNLGGSIVGFLATAILLNKIYGPYLGDTPKEDYKGAPFVSDESVKVLNLLNQRDITEEEKQKGARNKVVLTELYKLKKLTQASDISIGYATTGDGIEGHSVSHTGVDLVEILPKDLPLGKDQHLEKKYEMRFELDDLAQGQSVTVHNVLTFISAFDGKDKEWFHTHIDIPTQSTILVIVFPDSKLCEKVTGTYTIGENRPVEVLKHEGGPLRLESGKLIYWHIRQPQLGASYALEWEW